MKRCTTHGGRARAGFSGLASLVALLVCGAVLFGWKQANEFARPSGRFDHKVPQRIWWMGSRLGPAWQGAELEEAELIFAGDSRIKAALDLPLARTLGLESVSRIWCGGGNTAELLLPLLQWEQPRSLVVALTPLGFIGIPNEFVRETLRTLNPACDPTLEPWKVAQWTVGEKQHMIDQELGELPAEGTMRWWVKNHRTMRDDYLSTQRLVNTPRIDQEFNGHADRVRSLLFHPIEPSTWQTSWWRETDGTASNVRYRDSLSHKKKEAIEQGYVDLQQVLSSLIDRGWRVAAVRLPIDPTLLEVEKTSGAAHRVDNLVQALDIPFKDFGSWPDSTLDGSHLHMTAAARATTEIVHWLDQTWPDAP